MTIQTGEDLAEAWTAPYRRFVAEYDLDLSDEQDRAIFRSEVRKRTTVTRLRALQALGDHFGYPRPPHRRADAVRALEAALIARIGGTP